MATIAGVLGVRVTAETRSFESGVRRSEQGLSRLSSAAGRTSASVATLGRTMITAGSQARQFGQRMLMGVSAPILAIGGLAARAGGNFEQSMNRVMGITGATEEQFKSLADQAKQLGSTTQFSASQAADAMGFLAMAGFDTNRILAAMPGTLTLAASAQLDLAESADIVSNVMTGYGLTANELNNAVDVLTKTFTSANTDLSQLGQAFKYAGPVAKGAGLEFEETAAALGLMGQGGIQASMAGTAMRGALVRLMNPTKQVQGVIDRLGLTIHDSEGNLLSMVEIIEELERTGTSTADVMAIFGQRAGPAMSVLLSQGSEALRDLTTTLGDAGGTAQRVAEVNMRGLNGAWREFVSALEAAQIKITESGLGGFLENLLRDTGELLRNFTKLDPEIVQFVTRIAGIAAAIPAVIIGVGLLIQAFGVLATTAGLVGGVLSFALSPMMLGIVGLISLVALFAAAWTENWGDIRGAAEEAWERIQPILDNLRDGLSIGEVTVAVAGLWSISFARSFLAAVLSQAGITRAGAAAAARHLFKLGGVAVVATLIWEFVLPESMRETVVELWHDVADMIAGVNLGPLNPFRDRITGWLESLSTESWEVPALTVGVALAGLTIAQSGVRVAAMLGTAIGTAISGLFIPLATLGVAVAALTFFGLTAEQRQDIADRIQDLIGDPEINLVVKLARIAFDILPEAAHTGLDNLARELGGMFNDALGRAGIPGFGSSFEFGTIDPETGNIIPPGGSPGLGAQAAGPALNRSMEALLDALRVAEGNPNYGLLSFIENDFEFNSPRRNQLFEQFSQGLEPQSEEWFREAARASVLVYWEQFGQEFPAAADRAFANVAPAVQEAFVRWLAPKWAAIGAANDPMNLNRNWPGNVIDNLPGHHDGALLPGVSGPDQFPAILAPGEAVVPAWAVNQGATGVLDWFRRMGVPGFQSGLAPNISNVQIGDTTAGNLQSMVDGMQEAVESVGNVMLTGITMIMDTLLTVVETIARSLLGDDQFDAISQTISEARGKLQEFIEVITGQGPIDVTVEPTATVTIDGEQVQGPIADESKSFFQRVNEFFDEDMQKLFGQIAGTVDQVAGTIDTISNIDTSSGNSILEGVTSAAGDVASMIPGIGPAIGGAIKTIGSAVSTALGDMANGAAQVAQQLDDMAASSEFLSRDTFGELAVTERVSRGGLLGLFGSKKTALNEEATQAALEIANTFASSMAQGLADADFDFDLGFDRIIQQQLIEGFILSGPIQSQIVALTQFIQDAMSDGVLSATEQADFDDLKVKLGDDFEKYRETLEELFPELYESVDDNTDAMNRLTETLNNVPQGFKTNFQRFGAADRIPALDSRTILGTPPTLPPHNGVPPGGLTPLNANAGGDVNVTIVSNDPEEIWRKLQPLLQRENNRRSGTPVSAGPRFATQQ